MFGRRQDYVAQIITKNGAYVYPLVVSATSHKKVMAAVLQLMEGTPAAALDNVANVLITDATGSVFNWDVKAAA